MSRAQSPQVAAKNAERLRLQQRMEKLILAGVMLVMIPGLIAYIFFARAPRRGRGGATKCRIPGD